MNQEQIEAKVRQFLADDMRKEQAVVAQRDEPLDFDSLEQTELRVYLEEAFGSSLERLTEPFSTIGQIVQFVADGGATPNNGARHEGE
jgi:acyl carrier protein